MIGSKQMTFRARTFFGYGSFCSALLFFFGLFSGTSASAATSALVSVSMQPAFLGGIASRGTIGVQANAAGELEGLEIQGFGHVRPVTLEQLKNGAPLIDRGQGQGLVMTALPSFSADEGGFVRLSYGADEAHPFAGRSSLVQIVRDKVSNSWVMTRLHEDGQTHTVAGISLETAGHSVQNVMWQMKEDVLPEVNPNEMLRRFARTSDDSAGQSDRRSKGAVEGAGEIPAPVGRPVHGGASGSSAI